MKSIGKSVAILIVASINQYNIIENTMEYNTMQYNAVQWQAMEGDRWWNTEYNAIQCSTMMAGNGRWQVTEYNSMTFVTPRITTTNNLKLTNVNLCKYEH